MQAVHVTRCHFFLVSLVFSTNFMILTLYVSLCNIENWYFQTLRNIHQLNNHTINAMLLEKILYSKLGSCKLIIIILIKMC